MFLKIVLGLTAICFIFTFIVTRPGCLIIFSDAEAAVANTIGGATAPIIGIVSILVLYYTWKEQREFNLQQVRMQKQEIFRQNFFSLYGEFLRYKESLMVDIDNKQLNWNKAIDYILYDSISLWNSLHNNTYEKDIEALENEDDIIRNDWRYHISPGSVPDGPLREEIEELQNTFIEQKKRGEVLNRYPLNPLNPLIDTNEFSKKDSKDQLKFILKLIHNKYPECAGYFRRYIVFENNLVLWEEQLIDCGVETTESIKQDYAIYRTLLLSTMTKSERNLARIHLILYRHKAIAKTKASA